ILIIFASKYIVHSKIAILNLILPLETNIFMKINSNILKINLCDTIIKKIILSKFFFNLYKIKTSMTLNN
ncbi:hypothetical protein DIQ01_17475, partial [Acinetobacter baumannii]|nr:hypothetical protein [Acinetobacter baumannii]